jgi:hypothetical protein
MTDDFKERLRNTDHNWHEAACAEAEHRITELEAALLDVLVYCPDYMHGMPKKHYEKIARTRKIEQ